MFTRTALFSLHALLLTSSETLQQLHQLHQLLNTKKTSACRDLDKRINAGRISAARWNRLHLSFRVEEIHAILAPVVAVLDQFKLLPE